VTDRIRLDDLTSDQLDALYEQLDAAEESEAQRQLATAREALASATTRAARAEAAVARVRALHHQDGAHCAVCTEDFGRLNADWPCPTIRALDAPASGPGHS
jgi:septal ring factor EnvC (AmiA/AmiB activator)